MIFFDHNFYRGRKVFVTGHTGFKGTWLCSVLQQLGAEVAGYSRFSDKGISLFQLCGTGNQIDNFKGDVKEYPHLKASFEEFQPEIVFHLAAQPLVRESYQNPRETYETNVLGTVNILECIRNTNSVKSFLNVTTDKVYENKERKTGYTEDEPLDGFDPYSNSKSCSELVTHSYKKSFFADERAGSVSTARAGNVIGGGDFAKDRIIPDCVRAAIKGDNIIVRNPDSVRPYQHVLEPIFAYLMIAAKQYENTAYSGYYNVGPDEGDCLQTRQIVDCFTKQWGNNISWINKSDGGPHEAGLLKLDCSKLKETFGWEPTWNAEEAVRKTVEWSKVWITDGNINKCMEQQIFEFMRS